MDCWCPTVWTGVGSYLLLPPVVNMVMGRVIIIHIVSSLSWFYLHHILSSSSPCHHNFFCKQGHLHSHCLHFFFVITLVVIIVIGSTRMIDTQLDKSLIKICLMLSEASTEGWENGWSFKEFLGREKIGEFLGRERLESQILFGAIGVSLNADPLHINV